MTTIRSRRLTPEIIGLNAEQQEQEGDKALQKFLEEYCDADGGLKPRPEPPALPEEEEVRERLTIYRGLAQADKAADIKKSLKKLQTPASRFAFLISHLGDLDAELGAELHRQAVALPGDCGFSEAERETVIQTVENRANSLAAETRGVLLERLPIVFWRQALDLGLEARKSLFFMENPSAQGLWVAEERVIPLMTARRKLLRALVTHFPEFCGSRGGQDLLDFCLVSKWYEVEVHASSSAFPEMGGWSEAIRTHFPEMTLENVSHAASQADAAAGTSGTGGSLVLARLEGVGARFELLREPWNENRPVAGRVRSALPNGAWGACLRWGVRPEDCRAGLIAAVGLCLATGGVLFDVEVNRVVPAGDAVAWFREILQN